MRIAFCTSLLTLSLLASSPALSFQVSSPIHSGCHERLLFAALTRAMSLVAFPAQVTQDDKVLAHALQFDLAPYGKDRYTASLMLGVRYNDLHGRQATEFGELAPVHNEEANQDEHCLRRSQHDGAPGAVQAIEECKQFIRKRIEDALGGSDLPDARVAEEIAVYLRFRGKSKIAVSRLYFELGRAIHTLQDSFSHSLRQKIPAGGSRIVEVFNWVDVQMGRFVEGRDGIKVPSALTGPQICGVVANARRCLYPGMRRQPTGAVQRFLRQALFGGWKDDKGQRRRGDVDSERCRTRFSP